MIKTIHNEQYKLLDNEFSNIDTTFTPMTICKDISDYDSSIGLLKFFNKYSKYIRIYNCSHGGYIPYNLKKHYENIYIYQTEHQQIDNIKYKEFPFFLNQKSHSDTITFTNKPILYEDIYTSILIVYDGLYNENLGLRLRSKSITPIVDATIEVGVVSLILPTPPV